MSIDEVLILAPIDPKFLPTFDMFNRMCEFLILHGLSKDEMDGYRSKETFLRIDDLHLFPDSLTYFPPTQWNQEKLDLYERLFDYDSNTDYYYDQDNLRERREHQPFAEPPFDSEWYGITFSRKRLNELSRFFNQRYLLKMAIPLGQELDKDLSGVGFYTRTHMIYIGYGFHYHINNSVGAEQDEEYFRLFPYAPRALRGAEHPARSYGDLLLTYAGSFSLSFFHLQPLFFGEGNRRWPGKTTQEVMAQLKSTPLFYHLLKPGLEEIFQQEMGLFVGTC